MPLWTGLAVRRPAQTPVVHRFHRPYDYDETLHCSRSPWNSTPSLPAGTTLTTTAVPRDVRRMAGFLSPHDSPPLEGPNHVKFRVDRDVLADAVAWAARSLPVRPASRCSPAS